MGVSLSKGGNVSLTKEAGAAGLSAITVGLGWDARTTTGQEFDLDASAIGVAGATGKAMSDSFFVFFNNLTSPDGVIAHTGDNLTGEGDGDDEAIIIDFTKIPPEIEKIAVTVTIFDAQQRNQNFGQVSNAYVRVVKIDNPDDVNGEEVIHFDLMEEFSIETALVVCEIYRYNGDWKFNAVAAGYQGGLEALCRAYGVNV